MKRAPRKRNLQRQSREATTTEAEAQKVGISSSVQMETSQAGVDKYNKQNEKEEEADRDQLLTCPQVNLCLPNAPE